ncbi:sulfur carrier protein ThiS [Salinibius halmophilus]|uniref:sulfur carrier protein ThiS n=1 Tax=Salinibius halmophilus TaxID=1853216 RepID=UPI000E66C6EF|nr:sulfur carrier protein ThiS [Salinibius halmophilus]
MSQVSLNGEWQPLENEVPLVEALALWGYGEAKVAVAVNGQFVARSQHGEVTVKAGDQVDVVAPVTGG